MYVSAGDQLLIFVIAVGAAFVILLLAILLGKL